MVRAYALWPAFTSAVNVRALVQTPPFTRQCGSLTTVDRHIPEVEYDVDDDGDVEFLKRHKAIEIGVFERLIDLLERVCHGVAGRTEHVSLFTARTACRAVKLRVSDSNLAL